MSDSKSVTELCAEYSNLNEYIHQLEQRIKDYEQHTASIYSPNKKTYKELEDKLAQAETKRQKDIDELFETRINPLYDQIKEKTTQLDIAENKIKCKEGRIKQLEECIRNLNMRIDFAVGYISATQPHTNKHPTEVREWLFK
jgi:chromosome segregation ATPase